MDTSHPLPPLQMYVLLAKRAFPSAPCPDLYEAISRFALENAIQLLAKWRIIKLVRVEGAQNSKRAVQLSPEYQDHAKIEELVREISKYRKRSRVCRGFGSLNLVLPHARISPQHTCLLYAG